MVKQRNKKNTEHTLERLGLGENEANLYLLMLKYPKSTVQELQEKSPLTRTMLYHVLNSLTKEGLVTPVRQKWRTVYMVEDPECLYDVLERKQQEFEQQKTNVRELIPELRQTFRLSSSRPGVRLFEGLDSYKTALEDIFVSGADTIYAFAEPATHKNPGVELRAQFEREREERGIQLRVLAKDKTIAVQLAKEYKNKHLTEIKIVSSHANFPDVDLRLYAGKMMYTKYDRHEPIVTIFEDTLFYDFEKALFLNLYKLAN